MTLERKILLKLIKLISKNLHRSDPSQTFLQEMIIELEEET